MKERNTFQDMQFIQFIRQLTPSAYLIRIDRPQVHLRAGQNININIQGKKLNRDYSIYSGENYSYFELLIKERQEDELSMRLKKLQPGDSV